MTLAALFFLNIVAWACPITMTALLIVSKTRNNRHLVCLPTNQFKITPTSNTPSNN